MSEWSLRRSGMFIAMTSGPVGFRNRRGAAKRSSPIASYLYELPGYKHFADSGAPADC
jgi:hypothetical protein